MENYTLKLVSVNGTQTTKDMKQFTAVLDNKTVIFKGASKHYKEMFTCGSYERTINLYDSTGWVDYYKWYYTCNNSDIIVTMKC